MRRIMLLTILILTAWYSHAQTYGRLDFSLQSAQGQAIAGAKVNVYVQSACGTAYSGQAQLYSSATGGAISQPLYTDGFGHAYAYTATGCVTVVYWSQYTGTLTYADQAVSIVSGCGVSGACTIAQGGTGATTAAGALANLIGPVAYTADYASLVSAVAALPSGGQLIVNSMVPVTTTTILPVNINTSVVTGGFNISSGVYLQFQGGFDAGLYQVFFGAGPAFFYGGAGSTPRVYPQWFGAMGNAKAGGFRCTAGSNAIIGDSHIPWVIGDPITLIGAGTGGANLVTTVTGITGPGYPETGFTTAANCATTVSTTSMAYNVDDYPALAKWTRSASGGSPNDAEHAYTYGSQYGPSKLYLPKGAYNACSGSIPFYGGTSFEGESAVVTGNAMIIQCNPAIPAATLAADNFRPDANVVPTASTVAEDQGNGVSFFTNLGFYGSFTSVISPAHPSGLQTPDVGALQFLNGSNTNSDIKIHNSICEDISGTCFMMGFVTNTVGTLTSGATSMTVANGWSLLNGMSINIVGAGSAGGLYTGTITSAGRSNTITFTPATSTTVTAAQVMPVKDSEQFNLYDSESDVAVWYLAEGQGNVTGGVNVYDSEIFGMNSGAINFHSTAPMSVGWYNNTCNGCGSWGGYPNVLLGWAIYDKDGSNSHSATVEIDDSIFVPYDGIPILVGESTGGVYANGMFALNMSNDHFYGVEGSSGTANGVQSVENSYIDIKGSTFESVLGLNPGSNLSWFYAPINANQVSMIDVCCNAATLIHGNVSNITMIDPSGNVSGTYFDYIRGLNLEFIPNNGTFGPITTLGSFQASGGNNYFGTDIATQPLTPSTGAALGSANTFTANQTIGSSTAAANGYYIEVLNGAPELQLWETGSAGVPGSGGILPNTDLLLGFGANGTVIDSYFGPVKLVVGPGATPIESCTASTCTFSGSLANANGIVIPSTASGYTGTATGKVVLSTGTGYSGTCVSTTTLTVVNGIITGCS